VSYPFVVFSLLSFVVFLSLFLALVSYRCISYLIPLNEKAEHPPFTVKKLLKMAVGQTVP
jgi:hypothetical protein